MGYPEEPRTLGEHLRKRRLDLGLTQGQVAERFSATVQTVCNWEKGRSQPEPRHYPAVIAFLGYDPARSLGHWGSASGLSDDGRA